jgi:peptidoglycan-associated lipoprotein
MKIARPATLIAVALMALSLGFVGCKKGVQKPTTLYGRGAPRGVGGDERGGPLLGGNPVQPGGNSVFPADTNPRPIPGDTGEGIKAAVGEWDKWSENVNEFKDQTVYFEFDKANVKPSEISKLKEVARRMKNFPGKALRIDGHCDERGTEEYNRSLGDKRAQSIREFLASEGFDPSMMPTRTYGEDRPADPGHTEAAWSKNRRGELVLLSPTAN